MRDDKLDAVIRQALQDDPWRPDVAAAERRFAERIVRADRRAGLHLLKARCAEWLRAAQPGVIVVATAAAVVAVALLVAGPALLVRDTPGEGSDRLASGREAPAPPVAERPTVDPGDGAVGAERQAPSVAESIASPIAKPVVPPESTYLQFLAKEDLDGRRMKDVADRSFPDMYKRGEIIYVRCQELGGPAYGSQIWDLTREGVWVPDAFVKTGTDSWAPDVPRCAS